MRKLLVALALGAVLLHGPHAGAVSLAVDAVIDDEFDNVYGGTTQVVTKKAQRGKSVVFDLAFQNDDDALPNDLLTVDGCASSKGFSVTYADATGDVTAAFANGTFSRVVDGLDEATATMTVKVKKRGPRVKDCAISVSSSLPIVSDTVHAVVKVRR